MSAAQKVANVSIVGQIINPVVISANELNSLRQAREMFDELRDLLTNAVIPAIGGIYHPVGGRVYELLSQVNLRSGGFLASYWREAERFASAKEVTPHASH